MTLLFLLPALYNGFPLVFDDSGAYLTGMHTEYRSVYYTMYTWIFDMKISPWPGIILQSMIVSWTVVQFSSAVFKINDVLKMLSLSVFLTLGTSLPWFVSWIMPDVFAALMIMAFVLLCFAQDNLPKMSKIILVMLIGAALAFHQANLPVALWIVPALGVCGLFGWRPSKLFLRGFVASGIGLTLGVIALLTMNLVSGQIGLSRSGSDFMLARMLGDGTALRYLEEVCPDRPFAICAVLNQLKSYKSLHPEDSLSDYFLWGGPLKKLGNFTGEEAEASAIIHDTLLTYPTAQFVASLHNGWRQLLRCSTGSQIYPHSEAEFVSIAIQRRFGPAVYQSYRQSEQNVNNLNFFVIDRIDAAVIAVSSLLLIGFLIFSGAKRQPRSFYATVTITTMVIGNAITLGALSGPSERYQARVVWLVPLLAGCFVLSRVPYLKCRKQNEHVLEA